MCGNGVIDEGEECDVDVGDLDACDPVTCKRSHLFAFVASQVYNGSDLDTTIADAECNTIGQGATSPAYGPVTFRAWYSEAGKASAGERIFLGNPDALPYMRSNLTALDDAALLAPLMNALSFNEIGADISTPGLDCRNADNVVWTQTAPDGSLAQGCVDEVNAKGTVGNLAAKDATWTQACVYICTLPGHLYCVETRE